jgi:hypothetical protein
MAWRDSAGRTIVVSCPSGYVRHWFTVHGRVGLRSPVCVRCGAENPDPLSIYELEDYNAYLEERKRG